VSPLFLGKATDALLRGELPVGEIIVYVGLRFMVSLFEEGQRLVYLRVKQVRTSCLLSNAGARDVARQGLRARTRRCVPRPLQAAYHEIAVRTFAHLHSLSLQWHISKRSGVVLRAMDRGIGSASTVVDNLFLRLVRGALMHLLAAAVGAAVLKSCGG
jgi:hypothetical protein